MKLSHKSITLAAIVVALVCAATASASVTRTIKVKDNSFSKTSITISKNDKIKFAWQNTDNDHNVKRKSGPASVSSKTEDGSYVYTKKFTTAGTYSLHCSLHASQMKLSVIVKK